MHRVVTGGGYSASMLRHRKPPNPFRYFNTSPEVIRLGVCEVSFPLSLRNVEDLPRQWGIDLGCKTVRFW